jgi:hypothetical protein
MNDYETDFGIERRGFGYYEEASIPIEHLVTIIIRKVWRELRPVN